MDLQEKCLSYRQCIAYYDPAVKLKSSNAVKYGYRPPEAADALGSAKLLAECVAAGWIKPVVQRHKLTLYDRAAIASCWGRILSGEMPTANESAGH